MKKYLSVFSRWAIFALFVCFLCLPKNSFADWIQDLGSQTIETKDLEASGNLSVSGHIRRVPDTSSYSVLRATNTISPYRKSFIVINGTGTIDMSSTPTISTSAAYSGQELLILGGANPVTFKDNGTLSGSLLELGASSRTLSSGTWLDLVYYSGKWYERYNPAYSLDQSLNTTDAVTFATIDSGQGANELYDMDQNVLQASAVTFATVNTGQGANELYDMDQNLMVADSPTFNNVTASGGITAVTASVTGAATMFSIGATSGITAGWHVGLTNRTKAQLNAIRPTALGLLFFCSDCTEPTVVVSTGTTELGQFGALDVATW